MRVEGFAGRVDGGLGGRSQRRSWRVLGIAAAAGLSALWALALGGTAAAATPCGASGVFSQSGATATCTYSYTGSEQSFTVPAGVGSVGVTAVGAPGGTATCGFGSCGGAGAVVTATVGLQSGTDTLYVEVGGTGQEDGGHAFNGGGSGALAAGGGGASDVRTVSADDPASLSSRLVVGGGGGGGPVSPACFKPGGTAGDTSVTGPGNGGTGTDNCGLMPATPGGNGGFGGTAGGTGGTGGTGGLGGTVSCTGGSGSLGEGGDSVPCSAAGGGGGGGYYGGGAGGGGQNGAGGGGAGSSFWASGATGTSLNPNTTATGPAAVTISYTTPASTLAAQLVTASAGKGPGKALADKAAAIQAAVNAGQTATGCADITDYLGLVKAQTGKRLTTAQASQLTADANNLAAALGC